jgi:SAM-dependent methyltransferase
MPQLRGYHLEGHAVLPPPHRQGMSGVVQGEILNLERCARLFVKPVDEHAARRSMKIHFGAFNCPIDGWCNTDITPHLYLARVPLLPWVLHKVGKIPAARYQDYERGAFRKLTYMNVSKRWPFADESAEAIFSSHVMEHLPLQSARTCMRNAYRVLKKGGVFRVAVPDLDKQIADFKSEAAYEWACSFFQADQTREKNMHHFMYNHESMARLMREAGFSDITRVSFGQGICPDISRIDNRPESLFMEAIK